MTKPSGNGLAHRILQPEGWPPPRGYANAVLAKGTMIQTGGVIGWDEQGQFPKGFIAQTRQCLLNIRTLLAEAGAGPQHLTRLTWYVIDMDDYLADQKSLGAAYREVLGRCFPAMATVEVSRLVEPAAVVEIEATAVVPND